MKLLHKNANALIDQQKQLFFPLPTSAKVVVSNVTHPFVLTRSQDHGQDTKNLTEEQRLQICSEVVHWHYSPTEVGKKWNIDPDTMRKWIRQKGLKLPKSYKKMSPG